MTKHDKKKKHHEPEDKIEVEVKDAGEGGAGDEQAPEEAPDRVEQLESELNESRDKYLRAVAELDNFKRRTEKEKNELTGFVKANVFRDILGLVDDFERFFQHVENSQGDLDKGFVQGVELMHKSLQKVLERHGVQPVAETGVPVDYNLHEAVMTEPVDDESRDNTVLEVFEVGYKLGEMLIRPARVKVGVFGG